MASFTDNLQYLTEFNPYVQQLPVEAMVSVGQQKQQQYNQGVEKIQGQIDKIAGMDVVRDIDKQYLQSRLNDLGQDLKKVAAGDFSNYQLVNSVGGLATKIGKDPNIQNAVVSTARYRKGVSEMEAAIKEGKSSPSNEYVFNKQASEWLNSTDPKASFNGRYKPYTNWKKNALEVIKNLTKDETITDDAFTLDSKGNMVIADATVRKKLAGISPDKIQQALMVGLTPGDFEQMQIDGVYSYANLDAPRLEKTITSSHNSTIDFYSKQKKALEGAKSTTTSVPEKERIDQQIADIDKVIRGENSQYEEMISSIQQGNLDGPKAQLYTRNAIDGFSRAFSFTELSQTYENSPFAEAKRWRETKDMEWKKFIMNYDQAERHFDINKSLKIKELEIKEREARGLDVGGLPVGVPQEELPQYTLAKIKEETEQSYSSLQTSDAEFMRQNGGDEQWFEQQRDAYNKNPNSVEPEIALHFRQTEQQRRNLLSDVTMIGTINKEAERLYGNIYKYIPKDAPSVQSGDYTYTPKDIVDFNYVLGKYVQSSSGGIGGASKPIYDYKKAAEEMTAKEFRLFQMMGGAIPMDKQLYSAVQQYNKTVNQPFREDLKKINDYTADQVAKRITYNQGVTYSSATAKPEQRNAMARTLAAFTSKAESPEGIANSPGFDIDTAKKLMADPNALYLTRVVEGTSDRRQEPLYEMTVTGEKGTVEFRMTPEEKRGVMGATFEPLPQVAAIRPYQEQIRKMGGYTTNLAGGKTNPNTAFLGKIDFPSVNIYGIKGDIIEPSKGQYAIKLNIYDPMKGKWIENISAMGSNMISENGIYAHLQGLNDATIYQLINGTTPTAQELKELEELSKMRQ